MAGALETATRIEVVKLHPRIGAEIRGVDLSRDVDDEVMGQIKQAWYQNAVVVFRGQKLTGEQQLAFASRFGRIAERLTPPKGANVVDAPNWGNLMLISDRKDENDNPIGALGHGEMWFHTDKCYVAEPHRASFLYGIEIPTIGGNTRFSSLYAAYDNMPAEMKTRFDGAFVMQGHQYGAAKRIDITAKLENIHHHRQPMIVKNPDSGRKALYVSSQNTMWIEGIDRAESEAILTRLFELTEDEANIYEHVWKEGDLLMWDNLACLHARTDWPAEQTRVLRRCTVIGHRLS